MTNAIPLFGTVSSTSVFYGFILPWIFAYAMVFALLNRWNHFNRSSNIAISFVAAFFVTGVAGPTLAAFFITLFGGAAFVLAGMLVVVLFLTMAGFTDFSKAKWAAGALILIGIVLFVLSSSEIFSGSAVIDSATASTIFWIIIIVIAVYLISRGGMSPSGEGGAAPAPAPARGPPPT